MWNKFWNIKTWLQTESNENEWKAVLSLLRSILHRICNELWMKLLSLTQNPVCVSNIPQENEASVNKNTCLSFLFQLSKYMQAKIKQTKNLITISTQIQIFSFQRSDRGLECLSMLFYISLELNNRYHNELWFVNEAYLSNT